jgi:uncharacterized alkaline shock family protein YloU
MSPQPIPGRASVSRRAIADIVRAATLGSYGVTGFAGPTVRGRVLSVLGLSQPAIQLETSGELRLDLFLTVAYGLPVAEVARQVDSAVRYAVRRATGREFGHLSIHVDGLRFQPGGPPPPSTTAPSDHLSARDRTSARSSASSSANGNRLKPSRRRAATSSGERPS